MRNQRTDAILNPPSASSGSGVSELPEVTYLQRALQIAEDDGLGLARANVQRVESMWSTDDGDLFLLGLVLSLRSGARVYLHYCFDFPDDEEEV